MAVYAKFLGCDQMPELVNDDDHAQQNDKGKDAQQN